VVIRQTTVYAFSFLTVLGLAFGSHFLFNLFFAPPVLLEILIISGIVAGLFHPLTNLYLKIANRYFFASLYSYQETLKDLSRRLVAILDLEKLSQTIVQEIIDTMKLDKAGVLLRDSQSGKYQIQCITGFKEENGISLVKDNFLTQWLKEIQRPLIYEELSLQIRDAKREEAKQKLSQLKENMKRIEADLCLPLLSQQKIIGLIVLGKKISGEAYSKQDLRLLETLANQTALAVENARLYEQVQDLAQNLQQKVDQQVGKIKKLLKTKEELLTMKEDFLHIVSHQLRTPVSIFYGFLDWWKTGEIEKYPKEKQEKMKKEIIIAAERLKNIVNDMLDALEIERGLEFEFKPIDIANIVEEVYKMLKPNYEKKGLYLDVRMPKDPLPKIQGSQQFLKQALTNLVDNAEKYTEKGGAAIIVSHQPEKETITIEVKDTGIGLTEENKKYLFRTQFYRGERAQKIFPNGSGLGLYIVKRIIDKHHGQIEVRSEGINKGSSFIITLPIFQPIFH